MYANPYTHPASRRPASGSSRRRRLDACRNSCERLGLEKKVCAASFEKPAPEQNQDHVEPCRWVLPLPARPWHALHRRSKKQSHQQYMGSTSTPCFPTHKLGRVSGACIVVDTCELSASWNPCLLTACFEVLASLVIQSSSTCRLEGMFFEPFGAGFGCLGAHVRSWCAFRAEMKKVHVYACEHSHTHTHRDTHRHTNTNRQTDGQTWSTVEALGTTLHRSSRTAIGE